MECYFLCREHPGHLIELVRSKDYPVHVLPCEAENAVDCDGLAHSVWLGATQEQDAGACRPDLQALQPDWLVVDHYALDIRWEKALRPYCRRLMVIDDLADRHHLCDLLLDQNLGRQAADYAGLIPELCTVLTGPRYALLRPEFSALREFSLQRRVRPRISRILVSMGGIDPDNVTGQVLDALKRCPLPTNVLVTIVMGAKAPWLSKVQEQAATLPWRNEVLIGINDMAHRMAISDLAIGAAGSTAWERCSLGLPALMMVLAENQSEVASQLEKIKAALIMTLDDSFPEKLASGIRLLLEDSEYLRELSFNASLVTDGDGVAKVINKLL